MDALLQMDEKYSSQDGVLPGPVSAPTVTISRSTTPNRTPASSSAVVALDSTTSFVETQSLEYFTPEEQQPRSVVDPNTGVLADSPECGSPLTEESWDLLDQLELQATQRVAASQETGCSHDLQVHPPQPSPLHPSVAKQTSSNPVSAPHTSSEAMTSNPQARRADGETDGGDYKRFLVLEVDCDMYNRRLILRLLDDQDKHVEAVLAGDWFDSMVEAGDTINIVFTERDSAGFFSQDMVNRGTSSSCGNPNLTRAIQVDNEQNIVILHPDVLVRCSTLSTRWCFDEIDRLHAPTTLCKLRVGLSHECHHKFYLLATSNPARNAARQAPDASKSVSWNVEARFV